MIQYVCFLCRNAKTIEYKLCWGNFRSFWKVWFPNYRNHPVHSPHSSTPPLAWAMESHQPGSLRWAPPQTTIDLFLEGLLSIGLKPLNHHRSGQYQCTSHENTLTLRRPTSTQIQEYHIYIHQIFIHGISWGGLPMPHFQFWEISHRPRRTSKGGTCSAAQTSSAAPALTEARKVVNA